MEQYVYSEGDKAWFATFLARVEKQSKGFIGLSLTNFTTSTVCAVAEGSAVEIDGAMFIASVDTTVVGSIATGLNYIILSVTGTTANPYWSQAAASTYDTAKQGFYTAAERYVAGCVSGDDLSTYDNKWIYNQSGHERGAPPYATIPKLKIGSTNRSSGGDEVITGVGFRSSVIIFLAIDEDGSKSNWSVGVDTNDEQGCIAVTFDGANTASLGNQSINITKDGSNAIKGVLSAISADGFTITWTLTNSAGTDLIYLCIP